MSILTTLGGGSGIDTAQLVSDLVAAQRAGADALLQSRQEKVDARISTLSQIKSALSSFSTALNALVSSGSLGRQPVSSDSRSEEHTSELQSLMRISYAVFCLKKKT